MEQIKHTPGPWRMTPRMAGYFINGYIIAGGEDVALTITKDEGYDEANAYLIAAAPDLLASATAQAALIEAAQNILTQYLMPNGTADAAINELLDLFDGPEQRRVKALHDAAISKAIGA